MKSRKQIFLIYVCEVLRHILKKMALSLQWKMRAKRLKMQKKFEINTERNNVDKQRAIISRKNED